MERKAKLVAHWAAFWSGAGRWLAYNLLGMVGLWGGSVLFLMFLNNPPWFELVDRGQLFLYSVGFMTSSLYVLTKERRTTTFPHREPLSLGCYVAILFSVLLFAGITLSTLSDSPDIRPSTTALRYFGFATLSASVVIGYLVAKYEEERGPVDLEELRQLAVDQLESEWLQAQGGAS